MAATSVLSQTPISADFAVISNRQGEHRCAECSNDAKYAYLHAQALLCTYHASLLQNVLNRMGHYGWD